MLNSGSALSCEVEWKSPAEPNGRITKYFVSVRGAMRKSDGSLTPDDLPAAVEVDKRCANWDGDENTSKHNGINPIDFANEFYSCKFGPLKVRLLEMFQYNNIIFSAKSKLYRHCLG